MLQACFRKRMSDRDPEPIVQDLKDILGFWLNRGVDGFRMDADIFSHAGSNDLPKVCYMDFYFSRYKTVTG